MAAVSLIQLYAQQHLTLGPIQLQIEVGEYLALLDIIDSSVTDHIGRPERATRPEHICTPEQNFNPERSGPYSSPHASGAQELLQLIAGELTPAAGRIQIRQQDVTALPAQQRNVARLRFTWPQDTQVTAAAFLLAPPGSEADAAQLQSELHAQRQQQLNRLLEPLELLPLLSRPLHELNQGEFQRLALAQALLGKPAVLLCDPETLTPDLRSALRRSLQRLHRHHPTTLVYATDDASDAMMLADRIALLHRGELLQVATPYELYQQPGSVLAAQLHSATGATMTRMNCLPTRVHHDGRWPHLVLGDLHLPFPASRLPLDPQLLNRELILGIRPEHLRLGDYPLAADEFVTEGHILALELLGPDYQLRLQLGGVEITTRVSSELAALSPGLRVPVILRLRHLHLFDAHTGKTLSSPPPPLQTINDDELIMI